MNTCLLVTHAQAEAIAGTALLPPLEAPQGPTCIYRATTGRIVASVVVQSADFKQLSRELHGRSTVRVANTVASYCGTLGQPVLQVPLRGGRVLSITGACAIATRFAAQALPKLVP